MFKLFYTLFCFVIIPLPFTHLEVRLYNAAPKTRLNLINVTASNDKNKLSTPFKCTEKMANQNSEKATHENSLNKIDPNSKASNRSR